MRSRIWRSIVFLVFIIVVCGFAEVVHAQAAPIRGKVVDEDGAPLSGVQIVVTAPTSHDPINGRTKKKGTFTIVLPEPSWEYEFRFTLDGYQELVLPLEASRAANEFVEITLARDRSAAAAMAPAAEPVAARPAAAPRQPKEESMSEQRRAAIVLFNEAVTALEAGDTDAATTTFRRATAVDPGFAEAYRALMAVEAEAENWDAAANDARALLRIEPDDIDAKWTLYYALLRVGDAESVGAAARSVAAADPEAVPEMVSNALSLFDLDEFEVTRALLEVVTETAPDQVDAYFVLGMTCNALGDAEAAKSALEKFLEVAPEDHVEVESARSMVEYLE